MDAQSKSHHPNYDETTQVLIVGGGIVGLSTSLFLSWRGISSLLVERHPGTAIHPRIPALAQPTMEMFRSVGIEEAIHEVEAPLNRSGNLLLVESLVGQEFDVLQEDVDAFFISDSSPARGSQVAQDLLEPVLQARADQLGGICASGLNWWPSSRMKMASRPRSASGKAEEYARFALGFWWLPMAATAGYASNWVSSSMERACGRPSV